MAVHMTMDLPVTRADIEALSGGMGVRENPPDGLIVHVAFDLPEGGVRVVDLWESREQFEKFRETQLDPALEKALAEGRVSLEGPPPDPEYSEVYDLVRGKA